MSNDREEDVANVEREAAAQQSPQSGAGLVTGTTTPHAAAKGLPDAVAVVGLSERGTMFDPDRAHSNLIGLGIRLPSGVGRTLM